MTKPILYLDNAATTATRPEVVEAMVPYFSEMYGNPSSLHALGRQANKAYQQAQADIATAMGASNPDDFIFTGSATEANNWALKGIAWGLQHRGRHIITSAVEHAAIQSPCDWLATQGWTITKLPVDAEGFVSPAALETAIRKDTVLVSIMHGNNEVGTIQPIAKLGQISREHGVFFHTDAVQTIGKLPIALDELPIDLLSCSGHKLYGPKGIGFLYAQPVARAILTPLFHGGGQQLGLRSGTEPLPLIIGLAEALKCVVLEYETVIPRIQTLQTQLIKGIQQIAPQAKLNGPQDLTQRVPGNVNFSFAPVEGEALVLRFDLAGIAVSSGSACHSGALEESPVLRAMGATPDTAKSTVRFSLGRDTTADDIQAVLEALPRILEKVGYFRKPLGLIQ